MELSGQIIGIIAMIITALSYQANTKSRLLLIQSVATACTAVSYLLLGAASGFALNIACLVRNGLFYFQKEGERPILLSTALISALMIALGILSWQGMISLFIIIALVLNTVFLSLGKPQLLRYSILLTSTMVLIYNVEVFSIGGILNESIAILSSLIGIVRFHKKDCHM